MQKRQYKVGSELTNKQWKLLEPLLPEPAVSAKGGQKYASNRACLEGILWMLRTGARWRDMPERFPSGSTCRRSLNGWQEAGVFVDVWQTLLGTLDEKGRLKWDEVFADGTFSPAKKGATASEKRNAAREQSLWWWQMVRAYLSALSSLPRRPMNLR